MTWRRGLTYRFSFTWTGGFDQTQARVKLLEWPLCHAAFC